MPLHLIPMFIRAPKKVRPAMNIKHDSLALPTRTLPLIIILSHLNPLRLQLAPGASPLPPSLPTNLLHAMRAQLFLYVCCAFRDLRRGNGDLVDFHPVRMRHPLRGEALDFFDCVVRGVDEEFADEVQAFVVGDVRGGLLMEGLAVEVLRRVSMRA
jgi:hypothetical protein